MIPLNSLRSLQFVAILMAGMLGLTSTIHAQNAMNLGGSDGGSSSGLLGAPSTGSSAPASAPTPKPSAATKPKTGTEITCTKETNFSQKPPIIIFVGDVVVRDPQFDLKSDKLTVYLKESALKSSGSNSPTPTPKPKPSPEAEGGKGGGSSEETNIDRVVAEGSVVIVASRPGENKGETAKYVAHAAKAVYEAKSGDMILSGWPQVTKDGINTHVATEESTIMYINRDGRFRTQGKSKTVIQSNSDVTGTKQ